MKILNIAHGLFSIASSSHFLSCFLRFIRLNGRVKELWREEEKEEKERERETAREHALIHSFTSLETRVPRPDYCFILFYVFILFYLLPLRFCMEGFPSIIFLYLFSSKISFHIIVLLLSSHHLISS